MIEPLQNLNELEYTLVSARIPFLTIREVGSERQYKLYGNVVNVPNDLDVCAQVLPRSFNDAFVTQVRLMRRMEYKNPYLQDKISPYRVYKAAKYLINTELYKQHGILLSDEWQRYEQGLYTLQFIIISTTFTILL